MQDIEEFVGLDGKTYGPFRNSDRVELPAREAETLIKMRIAKISEV
jgi:DNA replication initiation complex subunit (GINS family)